MNRESGQSLLSLGGFIPLSTSDYPDHLSAVVFCQGCPWRCRYCHNPHLQQFENGQIKFEDVLSFLKKRIGILDALVFSGGEPTSQRNILAAVRQVKELGFEVALHTAAPRLEVLEKLLPELNWVGLDIKSLAEDYPKVTGVSGSGHGPFLAAKMLAESGIEFEVRTTVHPSLIDEPALLRLAEVVSGLGVRNYSLQLFRSSGCIDEELIRSHTQFEFDLDLVERIRPLFCNFSLRNL